MSDNSQDGRTAWLMDGAAAAIFGGAAGWCGSLLWGPPAAVVVGMAALLIVMAGLRSVRPEPRRYRLPEFSASEWTAEPAGDVLELTDQEPLLLQDPLPEPEHDSRVVQLFPRQPLPTAGELKARIDAHLERQPRHPLSPETDGEVVPLQADASAALRAAIADLRRSLA